MANTTRPADAFRGSRALWGPGEREMRLRRINDRLEENRAAIGGIEGAIAMNPTGSGSARLIIKVLETIKKKLEAEWLDVASQDRGEGGGAK